MIESKELSIVKATSVIAILRSGPDSTAGSRATSFKAFGYTD